MARGPKPKPPELVQRRNRASTSRVLRRQTGRRVPKLPALPRPEKWQPSTRAWWRAVWQSPMAAEFNAVDRHALARLARLVNTFATRPSAKLAAEIRHTSALFGLSPADRRRLGWTLADEPPAAPARRRKPPPASGDPRDGLRLVVDNADES